MYPIGDDTQPVKTDNLVVDLTERDAVVHVLGDLGIKVGKGEEIKAFDLALLTLQKEFDDLDPVLAELRARFAGRSAGWIPFLGKNRMMTNVFGAYPETRGVTSATTLGRWDPEPADALPATSALPDAGRGVRVGLLDTRIYDHPALSGRIETPDSTTLFTIEPTKTYSLEEGHGVFAAGLILQQAPAATLVARHVLRTDGRAYAWEVVKKLAEFYQDDKDNRVDVLVLASGCRNTVDGRPPAVLDRAMARLSGRMMVVAAAGNHGDRVGMSSGDVNITRNSATWPAALPSVVAAGVAGAHYSPHLPWVNCTVDRSELTPPHKFVSTYLDAPLVQMHSLKPKAFHGFASWDGTSCAAAVVGGAVAATMIPGKKSPEEALAELMQAKQLVKPFKWTYQKDG
jgi:hypothetical protein